MGNDGVTNQRWLAACARLSWLLSCLLQSVMFFFLFSLGSLYLRR